MSHELKTPMNAVFGSARLLLETALTPQQHEHVATTLAAGEAMLTIIEDAIDYAALEGGALALATRPSISRRSSRPPCRSTPGAPTRKAWTSPRRSIRRCRRWSSAMRRACA